MSDMPPLISLTERAYQPGLFRQRVRGARFWTWEGCAKLIDGIQLTEPREIALFELATGRSYNRLARRAVRRSDITCW